MIVFVESQSSLSAQKREPYRIPLEALQAGSVAKQVTACWSGLRKCSCRAQEQQGNCGPGRRYTSTSARAAMCVFLHGDSAIRQIGPRRLIMTRRALTLFAITAIIIGHLIPAGTGVYRHHDVEFTVDGVPMASQIEDASAAIDRELFPGLSAKVVGEESGTPAD
jgi:hypothetical protein